MNVTTHSKFCVFRIYRDEAITPQLQQLHHIEIQSCCCWGKWLNRITAMSKDRGSSSAQTRLERALRHGLHAERHQVIRQEAPRKLASRNVSIYHHLAVQQRHVVQGTRLPSAVAAAPPARKAHLQARAASAQGCYIASWRRRIITHELDRAETLGKPGQIPAFAAQKRCGR